MQIFLEALKMAILVQMQHHKPIPFETMAEETHRYGKVFCCANHIIYYRRELVNRFYN
jgi:hypothetical protein